MPNEAFCGHCGQAIAAGSTHQCPAAEVGQPPRRRRRGMLALTLIGSALFAVVIGGLLLSRVGGPNAAATGATAAPSFSGQSPSPSVAASVLITVTATPQPTPTPVVPTPVVPATAGTPPVATTPALVVPAIDVPAGTIVCSTDGTGIAATSMADNTWTSCVFADIVRQRYREAAPNGGAVWLPAVYTPKFNRYWDLQCENTEPVHCYAPTDGQVVVYLRRG